MLAEATEICALMMSLVNIFGLGANVNMESWELGQTMYQWI